MDAEGMRRFLKDIQRMHASLEPMLDMVRLGRSLGKMQASLGPMWDMVRLEQSLGKMQASLGPMRDMVRLGESLAKMQASFESTRDMVRSFLEDQEALRESYRKAQKYLSDEGWYLGGDMPAPNYGTLAKLVHEDRHADIEEAMCGWARAELDGITDRAANAFTGRAHIIRDAIDAHRAGTYSLSIPVLLAQSDGISNDIIGNCLFQGDPLRALENTLAEFDGFPMSEFSDILLDPLRSKSWFYTCSPRNVLKCGNTPANRSEILHGSQLDYASEANSLRAIVLLGYLVGVKSLMESHSEEVASLRAAMDEAMASDGTPDVATDGPTDPSGEDR